MTVLKYWDTGTGTYKTLIGAGVGVLPGGTTGQVLTKNTATDYDTYWSGPYLPLTGGTLSGTLVVQSTVQVNTANTAILNLNKASGANSSSVYGQSGASNRWVMMLGNSATESGSNAGSDFNLNRYSDAGAFIDTPLAITRSSGAVSVNGNLTVSPPSGGTDGVITITSSTGWPTVQWQSTSINPYIYSAFVDANKTFYFRDVTRGNVNVYTVGSTGMVSFNGPIQPTVGIVGTATNDNAVAGRVGEVISSNVTSPGVAVTSATPTNVTSISLTAGDWDVYGEIWLQMGAGGASACLAGISIASANLPGPAIGAARFQDQVTQGANVTLVGALRTTRITIASTTPVYLVTQINYPSGSCTAYGNIWARRMR